MSSVPAARFLDKINRQESNLQSIRDRVEALKAAIVSNRPPPSERWSQKALRRDDALERKLRNAVARAKRAAEKVASSRDSHNRQQGIIDAIKRAKKSIGSFKRVDPKSFIPGTYHDFPVSSLYTERLTGGAERNVDLGSSPAQVVTLAHASSYQAIRALKAKHLKVPWLPYQRSVTLIRAMNGTFSRTLTSTTSESGTGPLTPMGAPAPLATLIPLLPSRAAMYDRIGTQLLSKSLSAVTENDFDVLTQLVEARETKNIGKDLLKQTASWVSTHADLSREVGKLKGGGRLLPLIAASSWLSYQLALKPLISAVDDFRNFQDQPPLLEVQVKGPRRPRASTSVETSHSFGSQGAWEGVAVSRSRLRQRFGFVFQVTRPGRFAANQLHLTEPLSAIWEGVTLSFVVDYFAKVGEYIRTVEQAPAVLQSGDLREAWMITNLEHEIRILPRSSASFAWGLDNPVQYEQKLYWREQQESFPASTGIRLSLPSTAKESGRSQWLTMASLLTTLGIYRVDKTIRETPKLPRFHNRQDFLEHWLSAPVGYTSLSPSARAGLRRNLARREAG